MSGVPFETFASVDLGSNSFHMLVANVTPDGGLSKIDSLRDSVRLGEGLTADKFLTEEAQERALTCLGRFQQRLQSLPRGAVRVVGTNTLRMAKNASLFLRKAERVLGHPIEVISGHEEARLIYLGVLHGQDAREGKRLVVDIGGGSTEVILGEGADLSLVESFSFGCVSLSRTFFPGGVITPQAFWRGIVEAKRALLPFCQRLALMGWDHAIGCSGTIKAIRRIVRAEGWSDIGITRDALYKLKEAMIAAGHVDALSFSAMKESRRTVLAGGLCALLAIFEMFDLQRMDVSKQALREGLLYDLLGRFDHRDIREQTVQAMMERWHVDSHQVARVNEVAMHLFAQVRDAWELHQPACETLLRWACSIHELGLQISHRKHHHHGAYIISNADLPGFSFLEQQQLATLVLYHRKKMKIRDNIVSSERLTKPLRALCVILRLAVLFCRERVGSGLPHVMLEPREGGFVMKVKEEWLESRPLMRADLEAERKMLSFAEIDMDIQMTAI
jgi:exopolyphosphatase/guanosine-5'-triphosphate,3'-diphosphate pyrophosphatase